MQILLGGQTTNITRDSKNTPKMKTTVYKARRACQLEVKVEFNSLDKNYHNPNLQFTTSIANGDIEDLKISEFCPTISVYHIQDKNPTEVSLFLTFQKTKYLKCAFDSLNIVTVQITESRHTRKYITLEPRFAISSDPVDGEMSVGFDLRNVVTSPQRLKSIEGVLKITFEPNEMFVIRQAVLKAFSNLNKPFEPEDIGIICNEEEVRFNKAFLCKISDVFSAMLENPHTAESQEGVVKMENVSIEVVKAFKRVLCEGSAVKNDLDLELLMFADRYNVQPLVKLCKDKALKTISQESIIEIIKTADALNDDEILRAAFDYISDHKGCLKNSPQWIEMIENNSVSVKKMFHMFLFGN